MQIAQTKLDLSDRKTKRNLKNQERVNTHYTPLMQAINTARLKVFDFESQHAQVHQSFCSPTLSRARGMDGRRVE